MNDTSYLTAAIGRAFEYAECPDSIGDRHTIASRARKALKQVIRQLELAAAQEYRRGHEAGVLAAKTWLVKRVAGRRELIAGRRYTGYALERLHGEETALTRAADALVLCCALPVTPSVMLITAGFGRLNRLSIKPGRMKPTLVCAEGEKRPKPKRLIF